MYTSRSTHHHSSSSSLCINFYKLINTATFSIVIHYLFLSCRCKSANPAIFPRVVMDTTSTARPTSLIPTVSFAIQPTQPSSGQHASLNVVEHAMHTNLYETLTSRMVFLIQNVEHAMRPRLLRSSIMNDVSEEQNAYRLMQYQRRLRKQHRCKHCHSMYLQHKEIVQEAITRSGLAESSDLKVDSD